MKRDPVDASRFLLLALSLFVSAASGSGLLPRTAAAAELVVKPVVEKKVSELPPGPLFWRIENFISVALAQAAAGETGLAAEVSGKVWLFTLGAKGGSSTGGTKVAEIGPVPPIQAPAYLLRINQASGPPGATTAAHSHPGSEAFYVLAGRLGQKTPSGIAYAEPGQAMNGHGAGMAMVVFSAGTTELDQLVMFVVDATKPFSSPAQMPSSD